MSNELLPVLAALLVTFTGLLLLIASDWRLSIGALAVQYIGIFILVGQEWSLVMALTRLVAGWMAGAVLAMAIVGLPPQTGSPKDLETPPTTARGRIRRRLQAWIGLSPGPIFYILVALLVMLAAFSQLPRVLVWIPELSLAQAWGGLVLVGLGLFKIGFSARPLHSTLGLLTLFAGFEILYAAINNAALPAAISAAVSLGLALAGAYLMMAPYMEPNE